jgi:hypothetical protein
MIRRRGKIARLLTMLATAVPTIADGARGVWHNESGRKWLAPLLVFLCVTGLILIVGATVNALAPFVYAIF